ncbi:MAG: hypothetical protein H8Z69_05435 [Nanohaloarchaea archaeon]|nr:hypothetical protein [Candidatus Nanohaloarchaea archaeon]
MTSRARGVKFRSGMILGGNSHEVEIPSFREEAVQQFYGDFKNFKEASTGHETAQEITDFVNQRLEYDNPAERYNPQTGEQLGDRVPLEHSIKYEVGRCKEKAAAAQMLMQLEELESTYVKGLYPFFDEDEGVTKQGKHAWLKVQTQEGEYFADPTNGHFEPYDDFVDGYKGLGCQEIDQEVYIPEGHEDALEKFI